MRSYHWLGMVVIVLVGFWIGKNYSGIFDNIPLVNKVL